MRLPYPTPVVRLLRNCLLLLASFTVMGGAALAVEPLQDTRSPSTAANLVPAIPPAGQPAPLRVLFLGDDGHHRPEMLYKQLQGPLGRREIALTYTKNLADLNLPLLNQYDALVIYANHDKLDAAAEEALLQYVESGKGLVALHCASFCFLNSEKYIALVGGQFSRHGTGTFRVEPVQPPQDPLVGYEGFESWDETYVHTKHNDRDRVILEYRYGADQANSPAKKPGSSTQDGQKGEPWTWIRTQEKGRVFYTAWGHDERTWTNPGFTNLVERGIRWVCRQDPSLVPAFRDPAYFPVPKLTAPRTDLTQPTYQDVGPKIPNYRADAKRWGELGQALNLMQDPLPPAESLLRYQTPVGFELKLYASEENFLNKPIAMNWDERGRLWICETLDYPNELQKPGQGRDRIRICEDTNQDGIADKFTVFAEGLSIPTAILPVRGGALVQNATETLFLRDTTGDDVADERKTLITGWNAGDTHGGVSNFVYGPDNWIYAMQGYNDSHPVLTRENGQKPVATPGFRMGFFRFKLSPGDSPEVAEIEFLRSTDNNTWGIGFSEEGYLFGSTANRNPSVYLPIPNRYYEAVRGWTPDLMSPRMADTHLFVTTGSDKIRQVDQHGGYTAGAGHALYTARNYPASWWNRTAFVCEPTGKLVGGFVITPRGAGFTSKNLFNLVQSNDEWAAPIMAEVGPDGNVWILDWYNFVVQHNPTPAGFKTGKGNAYESDLRDKRHGRIYRLVYQAGDQEKASPNKPDLNLHNATPGELLAALANDNLFWRRQAQRLILERNLQDLRPQLRELALRGDLDAIGLNAGALHAVWTLAGLGEWANDTPWDAAFVQKLLAHPCAAVRRAILQVLPSAERAVELILAANVLTDEHPQVRLAALLALADQPESQAAGDALAKLLADAPLLADRWLSEAFTCAAARQAAPFLQAVAARSAVQKEPSVAANKLPNPELIQIVAEHWAKGKPDAAALAQMVKSLAGKDSAAQEALLTGICRGWPRDYTLSFPADLEQTLLDLLPQLSAEGQSQLIRWGVRQGSVRFAGFTRQLADSWGKILSDPTKENSQRVAAAQELLNLQPTDEATLDQVLRWIEPQHPPELAQGLLGILSTSTQDSLGGKIVARLPRLPPQTKAAAMRLLLKRGATAGALLTALEERSVLVSDLSLDQQQALANHPDKALGARAKKLLASGGGLPNPDREVVIRAYHASSELTGDAARGQKLFKEICAKCHRHSGEGANIGPDLTGMAVHPKHELLTQILDPSRSVEANFRQYTVETTGGLVYTGLLAAESQSSIQIIDTEAKPLAIPRDEIDSLTATNKSLMPEGFEKQLSVEQMTDLLEFLTTRGKYLPLPLNRVANAVSTRSLFFDQEGAGDTIVLPAWGNVKVEGVDFSLIDPQGDRVKNVVMLRGSEGMIPPAMPQSVSIPCNSPARAIHLLSGVSGWGYPYVQEKSVAMSVRIKYADGKTEDHPLQNGVHFADYIRRVDVSGSKFALDAEGKQIRYLRIEPKRAERIESLEFNKESRETAPLIFAVTVEGP
ncbi:MAG: ThuA domain-containing protein [Pirellulales bacterium]|nr:ThuA domain-containing protein [Pirellulales bacterium]